MIFYQGPSMIDGSPIVAIATLKSGNRKTGAMLQTWILCDNGKNPIENSRLGLDSSICGDCIHKGTPDSTKESGWATNRTCYVLLHQAPLSVYNAYLRGAYDQAVGHKEISNLGALLDVRVGSYGDPMAVPSFIWDSLLERCNSWTGYTHQANTSPDKYMTSADSLTQAQNAWARGERTFRVIASLDALHKAKEILCPASKEAGERTNCAKCGLCAGTSKSAKSIAIVAHGASKRKAKTVINSLA